MTQPKSKTAPFAVRVHGVLTKFLQGKPETVGMSAGQIETALIKNKEAPQSDNLRGYISSVLSSTVDPETGEKIFKTVRRGEYRPTSRPERLAAQERREAKAEQEATLGEIARNKSREYLASREGKNSVRLAYTKYRNGDGVTDRELDQLLEAITLALPYLQASPAFSLVYREAVTDREALEGFKRARKSR